MSEDPTDPGGEGPAGATGSGVRADSAVEYLKWGALVALGLLAVIAGVGLYTSATSIIDVWVAGRFQPIARAAFNFAVLCLAVAGMFRLLGRLRDL